MNPTFLIDLANMMISWIGSLNTTSLSSSLYLIIPISLLANTTSSIDMPGPIGSLD